LLFLSELYVPTAVTGSNVDTEIHETLTPKLISRCRPN